MPTVKEKELEQRKVEKKDVSARAAPLVTEMRENEERMVEVGGTYRIYRKMDGRLFYISFTEV
jgi:hypothetical protein